MERTANLNTDEYVVVAHLTQSQSQYEPLSLELVRVTESQNEAGLPIDTILLREYDGCLARYYKIPDPEWMNAVTSGYEYLRACAKDWAVESDDPVEYYRWGLCDPADDAPAADYDGACLIVRVRNCFGYTPIDYVRDEWYEPMLFSCPASAQMWINEKEGEIYTCDHNEAGRPKYYIVEAN